MYYLGIDLHKDESHVAVLDDDAEVVEEIRVATRILTTLPKNTLEPKRRSKQPATTTRSTTPSTNTSTWLSQIPHKPRRSAMLK
jgi:hypothetical protein